jgi:hypothetical protein
MTSCIHLVFGRINGQKPRMISLSKNDWKEITKETFKKVFKNSLLKRAKFEGIN